MVVHRPVLLLLEGAVEATLAPRPALPGGGKSVVDTSAAALSAGAPAVARLLLRQQPAPPLVPALRLMIGAIAALWGRA